MTAPGLIAVTGATGTIGRALSAFLGSRGYQVRALVRRPDDGLRDLPNVSVWKCDLPDQIDAGALDGCAAVVHCAYVTRFRSVAQARRVNEEGMLRLLELSRAAGVPRFIFLSTTSAHAAARSYYGQSKFRLESALDPSRDLVVRPGLVISESGGLFGRMVRSGPGRAGASWVVPLFGGGTQPMQTIHIDDLTEGLRLALEQRSCGALTLASPERITVREFFEAVAAHRHRRARFIDVPPAPALAGLRVAEAFRIPLPISSENLLGLLSLTYMDPESDLHRIGLTVRPLAASLASLSMA